VHKEGVVADFSRLSHSFVAKVKKGNASKGKEKPGTPNKTSAGSNTEVSTSKTAVSAEAPAETKSAQQATPAAAGADAASPPHNQDSAGNEGSQLANTADDAAVDPQPPAPIDYLAPTKVPMPKSKVTATKADILFSKVKRRDQRGLDVAGFVLALQLVANLRYPGAYEHRMPICARNPTTRGCCSYIRHASCILVFVGDCLPSFRGVKGDPGRLLKVLDEALQVRPWSQQ